MFLYFLPVLSYLNINHHHHPTCSSFGLSKEIQVFLHGRVGWVNLERSLVLCYGLADPLQLAECVAAPHRHAQVHLLQAFHVCCWNLGVPVLVVADQSDCLVALGDDSLESVKRKEAGDLVDVDRDVVECCGLASHLQRLVVGLEGRLELALLQQLVGLLPVLREGDPIKLLLHALQEASSLAVARLQDQDLVEVRFRRLVVLQGLM